MPLQVVSEPSQYFTISHCAETVCTKIAPGMSYQFKVNFIPEEQIDYKHQVTFITERESFTLFLLGMIKDFAKISWGEMTVIFSHRAQTTLKFS